MQELIAQAKAVFRRMQREGKTEDVSEFEGYVVTANAVLETIEIGKRADDGALVPWLTLEVKSSDVH